MKRENVSRDRELKWDTFLGKPPGDSLSLVYNEVHTNSEKLRNWYWKSIGRKKTSSIIVRVISSLFGVLGVVAPLGAAVVTDDALRLYLAQAGVVGLAAGGLVLLTDKVFGWSSGWLRYVTTVTAMERRTMQFDLDWASSVIEAPHKLEESDVKSLLDLAIAFQKDMDDLRGKETDAWVADFNAGVAALNEMIKTQRAATDKAAEAAQAALDAKKAERRKGALQIRLEPPAGSPRGMTTLYVDGTEVKSGVVTSFGMREVEPGFHVIRGLLGEGAQSQIEVTETVEVKAGELTTAILRFG